MLAQLAAQPHAARTARGSSVLPLCKGVDVQCVYFQEAGACVFSQATGTASWHTVRNPDLPWLEWLQPRAPKYPTRKKL